MSHSAGQEDEDYAFGGPFLALIVLLVRLGRLDSEEIPERKP
jgi:hypothetical protein